MNKINKSSKLAALLGSGFLISIPLGALASLDYTVKKGDTLSHIANKFIKGKKLYGTNGSVIKLMQLNTYVKNPNIIEPGQIILLSKAMKKEIVNAEIKDQVKVMLAAPERTYSIFENPVKRTNKKIQFTISTSLSTNNIDLVNSDTRKVSTFATDPSLGAKAKLEFLVSKRLNLEVSAGLKTLKYRFKGGGEAKMVSTSFGLFGAHATYLIGNSVRLKAGVKSADRAYAVSKLGTQILQKQVTSPELGLSLKVDETKKSVSTMSVLFTLLPETKLATETITAGVNTRASLGFQWDHLNVEPFLNWATQNVDVSSQQNLDLGLNLGYRF
jgi:LysM repeat protein